MTVDEAASVLRVSVITIRRWLQSGKLTAARAGRKLLINPVDIQRLLERNAVIVRGAPLIPGSTAALTDAELPAMGEKLVSFLRRGGWPIDLLPITADALRPVLLDQAQAGPLFWRTLVRAIGSSREKPLSGRAIKELSDAADAWKAGKGEHPIKGEER